MLPFGLTREEIDLIDNVLKKYSMDPTNDPEEREDCSALRDKIRWQYQRNKTYGFIASQAMKLMNTMFTTNKKPSHNPRQ